MSAVISRRRMRAAARAAWRVLPDEGHRSTRPDFSQLVFDAFRERGFLRRFPAGALLFAQEDLTTAAFAIEEGLVRVSRLAPTGREITFFLRYPGHVFGYPELLLGCPRMRFAQALKPTSVWVLPRADFEALIDEQPIIVRELLRILSHRFLEQQRMVEAFTCLSVGGRLVQLLLKLAADVGWNTARGTVIPLAITHEQMATILGASRQTVTSTLSGWRDQGLIEIRDHKLFVPHWDQLVAWAAAEGDGR